jgi:holo-[acyl-carrier protein] synthase
VYPARLARALPKVFLIPVPVGTSVWFFKRRRSESPPLREGICRSAETGREANPLILGLGVDLCRIERMRRAAAFPAFREKVFAPEEIAYAESRPDSAVHFASAFAAKEAFAKATGLGIFRLGFLCVRVDRTETGPLLRFEPSCSSRLPLNGAFRSFLSLSHDGEYAVASVVLEVLP